jgi:hypothetical protein
MGEYPPSNPKFGERYSPYLFSSIGRHFFDSVFNLYVSYGDKLINFPSGPTCPYQEDHCLFLVPDTKSYIYY